MEKLFYFLTIFSIFVFSSCDGNFDNELNKETQLDKIKELRETAIANISDPEKAQEYAEEMLRVAKEINAQKDIGDAYNILGSVKRGQNKHIEALRYFLNASVAFELASDTVGMGKIYNNIGNIYGDISKYEDALYFYQKALTAKTLLRDRVGIAVTNRNMAFVYQLMEDYESAKDSYWTALYTWKMLEDEERMAQLYNDLGVVYDLFLDNNKVISYNVEKNIIYNLHLNSLELNKRINNQKGMGWAFNNIGVSLVEKEDYEDALSYFNRSLSLKKEIDDQEGLGATYNNIGYIYSKEGKVKEALAYFKLAEKYAKEEELKKTYEYLIAAFEGQEDFAKANSYLKKLDLLNEELLENRHREELAQIEARYAVEYAGL